MMCCPTPQNSEYVADEILVWQGVPIHDRIFGTYLKRRHGKWRYEPMAEKQEKVMGL
jgi:hypothetical protein